MFVDIWRTPLVTGLLQELMQERGFSVDHNTVNRWVLQDSTQLEACMVKKLEALVFLYFF